ncbi:aminoacyl-tRNA hydrolase [Candidatus Babeliales bacterium]|nr:aminoacyl-tRNA hydrolase [Candidatus Babeliales bacterium]
MMENFNIKNIKAIIGLGNPGTKYQNNRHNIGFRIVDCLAERFGSCWQLVDKFEKTQICLDLNSDDLKKHCIFLIKPMTFMNNSGQVISYLSKKGIKPDQILVVHDELEKKFGKILINFGGSARGHRGLLSIISLIGKDFWRIRFGIGRPENKEEVSLYVLSNFYGQEATELDFFIGQSVNMILEK